MNPSPQPTLSYERRAGHLVRGRRSIALTLSGLFIGLFAGSVITCGLLAGLDAWLPTPAISGWPPFLLVMATTAAAGAYWIGRGPRLRLVAAKEIREDLLPCLHCQSQTWHVLRTYDMGFRSIECENCHEVVWER